MAELPYSIALPTVRRVQRERGSYVEPALDQSWSESEKLAWHAAVVAYDSGIPVGLYSHAGDDRADLYGVTMAGGSMAAYTFGSAWTILNGIAAGARAGRVNAAAELEQLADRLKAEGDSLDRGNRFLGRTADALQWAATKAKNRADDLRTAELRGGESR